MSKLTVKFTVAAEVTQNIDIVDSSFTPADVLSGLQSGTMTTTIAHNESSRAVREVLHWGDNSMPVVIGYVIEQRVEDIGTDEYTMFE